MKAVSILILSDVAERGAWLLHRLRFLAKAGHKGEVLVGVWGGFDKLDDIERAARTLPLNVRFIGR